MCACVLLAARQVHTLVKVPLLSAPRAGPAPPDTVLGFLNVFVELVALSACDAIVHTRSGFSKTAVEWGGLPTAAVRVLPRTTYWRAQPQVLTACGRESHLRDYYRMGELWYTNG